MAVLNTEVRIQERKKGFYKLLPGFCRVLQGRGGVASVMAAAEARRVIIYGGKGALGSTCVQYFKSKHWWVASIDLTSNQEASASVVVKPTDSFTEQAEQVTADVGALLGDDRVDAILCVAGGWAGGSAKAKALYKNSDLMWKQSVWTSTIAGHLATKHLREGGLLTLTGAKASLEGTPGMIGYGMAKAAVHHLCQSLAQTNSGLPNGATTVAILPVTLDTPMNRKFMPDADVTSWTPLDYVAELLYSWAVEENRPASGTLMQLITADNQTQAIPT